MKITINNLSFEIEPSNNHELWNYIASGKWEIDTFSAIDSYLPQGGIAIDIGSWAGPISLYMAFRAKRVISIDPDPVIFNQLLHNVNLNDNLKDRIDCKNLALTHKPGHFTLTARKSFGDSASSLLRRVRDEKDTSIVQGITLKQLMKNEKLNRLDFIKIDIEGGEFSLIPEIIEDLAAYDHPTLFVSFHVNFLIESIYFKFFRIKLFCLIVMKIETILGINLLRGLINKAIKKALIPLRMYSYVYLNGTLVSLEDYIDHPKMVGNNNFIFTNRKY